MIPSLALCVPPAIHTICCCRFQADAVVFLHDDQPHADYWPTKVCQCACTFAPSQGVYLQMHTTGCPSAWDCDQREMLRAHAG